MGCPHSSVELCYVSHNLLLRPMESLFHMQYRDLVHLHLEIKLTLEPHQHTSLGALVSLLSAGLAFLNFPAGSAGPKIITTGLQQMPGEAKAMLETGSLGSLVTPLDEIDAHIGDLLEQFQINIANALNTTQPNYQDFAGSVSNGSFIGNTPSINMTTSSLSKWYKTYIVSQPLQSHNIILAVAN